MKTNNCECCGITFTSKRKRKLCNECYKKKVSSYVKQYYKTHRNQRLSYQHEYYNRKRNERLLYQAKYNAKKRLNDFKYGSNITDFDKDFVSIYDTTVCEECATKFTYKFEYKPVIKNNAIHDIQTVRYNTTHEGAFVCPNCGLVQSFNNAYTMDYYLTYKPRPATTNEIKQIIRERKRDYKRDLIKMKEHRYAKFFPNSNNIDFLSEAESVRKMLLKIKKDKSFLSQKEIDICLSATFRQFQELPANLEKETV